MSDARVLQCLCSAECIFITAPTTGSAEYSDERVCLSVCVCVCLFTIIYPELPGSQSAFEKWSGHIVLKCCRREGGWAMTLKGKE